MPGVGVVLVTINTLYIDRLSIYLQKSVAQLDLAKAHPG